MSGGDSAPLLRLLAPYAQLIRRHGWPPEKVHPATAAVIKGDWSPIGFAGAVLPFLDALDEKQLLQQQRERIRKDAATGATTHYYDQVLILFGEGWVDGLYRFDTQGRVLPRWAARDQG
jgi:endoglucanase